MWVNWITENEINQKLFLEVARKLYHRLLKTVFHWTYEKIGIWDKTKFLPCWKKKTLGWVKNVQMEILKIKCIGRCIIVKSELLTIKNTRQSSSCFSHSYYYTQLFNLIFFQQAINWFCRKKKILKNSPLQIPKLKIQRIFFS